MEEPIVGERDELFIFGKTGGWWWVGGRGLLLAGGSRVVPGWCAGGSGGDGGVDVEVEVEERRREKERRRRGGKVGYGGGLGGCEEEGWRKRRGRSDPLGVGFFVL